MPDSLPIDERLPAITAALGAGSTLLLQAPPGAGKTTRVPLALLDHLEHEGKILMLEPRRLAARAAAERLAADLGEPLGRRVGYSVRLESRTSAATRVEVVTAGLFLRRLQADPALEGVACVIFDEFHERRADADLALALVRQARGLLCPELRLVVMSATLDLASLAAALDGAQVITSTGRSHPVEVRHQVPREGERLERQVLRALEDQWLPQRGSAETVLVFLPGQREIEAARRTIEGSDWGRQVECTPLHGHLSLAGQRRAILATHRPAGKVVLATAIAESSLTIEGVSLVIDSGLSRISRFDPSTGMDGLVTVPTSLASAEQRRGRAGRLGPGRCLRLWAPAERQRRPTHDLPELVEADPVPIALQLAEWGTATGEDLPWLDPPPRAALAEARSFLEGLGALGTSGSLTPHGRALARLGIHPRLGHLLLAARQRNLLDLGCGLAVLLSERDPLDPRLAGCNLLARLDWLRGAGEGEGSAERSRRGPLRTLQAELRRLVGGEPTGRPDRTGPRDLPKPPPLESEAAAAARLVALAYPERIALGRGRGDGSFLLRGGRGARVHPQDPLAGAEALAIATVDGQGSEARVLLALPLPRNVLEELAADGAVSVQESRWDPQAQRVRCERITRLGALVLERVPWPEAEGERVVAAMLEGVREMGLGVLPWCDRSRRLQQRLLLAHRHRGLPWPDRSAEALLQGLEGWLAPHLGTVRSRQDLQRIDLVEALWGDLDWAQRRLLADWLPEHLTVPSGRRIPLDYSDGEPVLAVKLQEMFGCRSTPALLEGNLPVTVHLLSPAGRAAAITRDLEGFWANGYDAVRRELRGRYPKHPWPADPLGAEATALTRAGLARATGGARTGHGHSSGGRP